MEEELDTVDPFGVVASIVLESFVGAELRFV